jgi:hypothetical protein
MDSAKYEKDKKTVEQGLFSVVRHVITLIQKETV